jgi:hypothetical protein
MTMACRRHDAYGIQSLCNPYAPSSRATFRSPSPLRTVHESFPSHSSSPSNAPWEGTRFRYSNTLVVNPVMAFRMK